MLLGLRTMAGFQQSFTKCCGMIRILKVTTLATLELSRQQLSMQAMKRSKVSRASIFTGRSWRSIPPLARAPFVGYLSSFANGGGWWLD